MSAASRTRDLRPDAPQRPVLAAIDRPGQSLVEGRPAAARVELGRRLVERRRTRCAGVGARRGVGLVRARVRRFGALLADDAELLCGFYVSCFVPVGGVVSLNRGGKLVTW